MKKPGRHICLFLLLFFYLGLLIPSQENQSILNSQMKDALMTIYKTDKNLIAKLKEEILSIYQSKSDSGIRSFIKKRRNEITFPIILEFLETGIQTTDEQTLQISTILADEKKNEKAVDIWCAIIADYNNNNISASFSEYSLYATFYFLSKMEMCKCNKSMERSFECLENLIPELKKINHPDAGNLLTLLNTTIYSFKKEFKNMEKVYDEEIQLTKDKGYYSHQGNMYLGKGAIYLTTGEYEKAGEMLEKALPLYEKVGDYKGQGSVYMLWGSLYIPIGDYTRANQMFDKALPLLEKAGDLLMLSTAYRRKAEIFLNFGEPAKSLDLYDKALYTLEKVQNTRERVETYIAKGKVYQHTGDKQKAREMCHNALALLNNEKDTIEQRRIYEIKGLIDFIDGNYSNAIDMYEKAIPFYSLTQFGHFGGEGDLYRTIGELHFFKGNYSKAVEKYDQALEFYNKLGMSELLSPVFYKKGMAMWKLGKTEQALRFFEESIDRLEKIRWQAGFSRMKLFLMGKTSDQYQETTLFMLENKFHDKAFKYAESMKARVFLDQMAEGLERPEKGLKPELKEKRDSLVGKLSALSRQMQETPGNEEKKLQELKEQYRQVESESDDLLIKIRLDNPLYASINYPQPISVNDLQTDVLKKGETLLSFFISGEKTFVFIVSKENFQVKQLEVTENEINGLVSRHLQAINENNSRDIIKYGTLLHEKLFKPMEKYVKKSRDIIIVPSGELETIPFESLVTGKNKSGFPVFLLEKYRVKYLQSATLLPILRKHYKRDNGTQSFIGFGDPVYETAAAAAKEGSHKETQSNTKGEKPSSVPSVSSVAIKSSPGENETPDMGTEHEILEIHRDRFARAGGSLPRLPNSGEEVNTIAQLFSQKGQKTRVFLRDQASEANAKSPELKDFDYIHFSCHGLLNDDFQCLVLSHDAEGKEDGYLTLNEIMNCDFNAKLVVLSACMTGSGKKYKGEGVTGLTRAVMYAGSPSVIASLWKVDDFATKELMVNFYKNLLDKNLDKSEALRLAKLELLKTEKYRSPFYWSAFVMYGE